MSRKQCLWRLHRNNPCNALIYESYRKAEPKCCTLIFKMKVRKENVIFNSNNLGSFYKYANRKLSNHRGIGTLLDNAGNTHGNDLDKANLLNNYFSSVCALDNGLIPDVVQLVSQSDEIDSISFSPVFVARALCKVKPSHSCEPDCLPSVLYTVQQAFEESCPSTLTYL